MSDAFEMARAEALLRGYDARWLDDAAGVEVLAVEAEFRAPLINPETGAASRTWQRGGKIDAVIRGADGRVLIVEHKTASEDIGPGSAYWKKLRMDGQVSGYFLGADALGFHADACLYDVIGKIALRPYQIGKKRSEPETATEYLARCLESIAEDPNGYYQRGEVVRLAAEAEEALFDDWQTAQQMRESERLGRFPRNPDACMKWGRACDYFEVCTGEASITDPHRFQCIGPSPELSDAGGLPILSASRLRSARSCQRLHRFQYVDGVRPVVESEPLRFGHLIHVGLEAWWKAPQAERLEAALAALNPTQPLAA
jgi:hypothetical protein